MRIAELSVHGCPLKLLGTKDTGGMNVYLREISRELGKRGISVDVFTRAHNSGEPEIMPLGENARIIHLAAGEPEDAFKEKIYYHLPELICSLRCFLDREKITYDLWHSHYWLSAYTAQQLKPVLDIPQIITFHTLGAVKNRARPAEEESELRIVTEGELAKSADRIIALTRDERDDLINIYGARPERVQVIPGGVDVDLFRPMDKQKARSELGLSDGKILLFAGRVEPIKGVDILLHAIASLKGKKELHLLIVGGDLDGNGEVSRLRSLAGELDISDRMTFWGSVEQEKMPLFYNAVDICVVPSLHESFCLVSLEAAACGTPVVASRVGGLMTTVRDGETGFLVSERSPEAFAGRLELILDNAGLAEAMGKAGRASAMEYQWSTIAEAMLRVYRQMIDTECKCSVA
jgi:D-inositol-3-phosphate glycosyltransferase